MTHPSRGELWWVEGAQTRGHEQSHRRPALVLSVDAFNRSPAELASVLLLTSKDRGIRAHVRIEPTESGMKKPGFVKCEEPRTISKERFHGRIGGPVSKNTMTAIEARVRYLLGL